MVDVDEANDAKLDTLGGRIVTDQVKWLISTDWDQFITPPVLVGL